MSIQSNECVLALLSLRLAFTDTIFSGYEQQKEYFVFIKCKLLTVYDGVCTGVDFSMFPPICEQT